MPVTRYVLPGVYLEDRKDAQPTPPPADIPMPVIIARGSRLAAERGVEFTRSFREGVILEFSQSPPYRASLPFPAEADKRLARLYTSDEITVPDAAWAFIESDPVGAPGVYDQVEIAPSSYASRNTYVIDYQSTSRLPQEPIPFKELREVVVMGDVRGEDRYVEGQDYRIVADIDQPVVVTHDDALAYSVTPDPGNTGAGVIAVNAITDDTYQYLYGRRVVVVCTVAGGPAATFSVQASHLELGGQGTTFDTPLDPNTPATFVITDGSDNVGYDLGQVANVSNAEGGLLLDFTFNAGFALGDSFTVDVLPPASLETPENYANDSNISELDEPTADPGNLGTGTLVQHPLSEYDDDRNRDLVIIADNAVNGTAAAATIVFDQATAADGDLLFLGIPGEQQVIVEFDADTDMSSLAHLRVDLTAVTTDTELRDAVLAALAPSAAAALGPVANGAASIDVTWPVPGSYPNANTAALDVTAPGGGITSAGYTGGADLSYDLDWIAIGDSVPTAMATHSVTVTGEEINPVETVTLPGGIQINASPGATNFSDGDQWSFSARAARPEVAIKDDRTVTLILTAINTDIFTGDITSLVWSYTTNTPEGGFGQVISTVDAGVQTVVSLPDNMLLTVHNVDRLQVNDSWTVSSDATGLIDWGLVARETEEHLLSDINVDNTGARTGTPGARYINLVESPSVILSVSQTLPGVAAEQRPIAYTFEAGSTLIVLTELPVGPVTVRYVHRGQEPPPGGAFFMTAYRVRAPDQYDSAILHTSVEAARRALSPMTLDNLLLQVVEQAFQQGVEAIFTIQVSDPNSDGAFTDEDYRRALQAAAQEPRITDLAVPGGWGIRADILQHVIDTGSARARKRRVAWLGAPTGTPIGDPNTPGTLAFASAREFRVEFTSPGLGRVVLMGNTSGRRKITLEDGSTAIVTHDGSAIAAVAAAVACAQEEIAESILKDPLLGYEDLQHYGQDDLLRLGEASITTLAFEAPNQARFIESITVHSGFGVVYHQISTRRSVDAAYRAIERDVDAAVVGVVPESVPEGIILVGDAAASSIENLIRQRILSPYTTDEGTPRDIDISTDVRPDVVLGDKTSYTLEPTLITRAPIARVFGQVSSQ